MQNYNSKLKSDLKARCYKFSLSLITFMDTLSNQKSTQVIVNQVLRSGTSVGANLVEATASSSRIEFKKFHEIALKSANETKYWLHLLLDLKRGDQNKLTDLINEIDQIAKMLASGILKLKGKR